MWPQPRFIKHRSNERSSFQKYALWFPHCRFNFNTSTCACRADPRLFPHPRPPLICSGPWKNVCINGNSIPLLKTWYYAIPLLIANNSAGKKGSRSPPIWFIYIEVFLKGGLFVFHLLALCMGPTWSADKLRNFNKIISAHTLLCCRKNRFQFIMIQTKDQHSIFQSCQL